MAGAPKLRTTGRFRQAKLERWYEQRVEQLGPRARSGEEDDLKAARLEVSEHVTRESIRDIRKKRAPQEWRSPGRPSRNLAEK
jgi:hypothetical protein